MTTLLLIDQRALKYPYSRKIFSYRKKPTLTYLFSPTVTYFCSSTTSVLKFDLPAILASESLLTFTTNCAFSIFSKIDSSTIKNHANNFLIG